MKTANLTVTSGSQTASSSCNVVVNSTPNTECSDSLDNDGDNLVDFPNDPGCTSSQDNNESNTTTLLVSCIAAPNTVSTNQQTNFIASASGGNGVYSYQWSQNCSGSSYLCSNTFSTTGIKTAQITLTSAGQSVSNTCSVSVNNQNLFQCSDSQDNDGDGLIDYPNDSGCSSSQDNDEFNTTSNLVVSCVSSPNPGQTNQLVTFIASVSGGTGSYIYNWSGSCSGSAQSCFNTFSNPGNYNAVVNITSGNQNASAFCSANVLTNQNTCVNNAYQQCVGNSLYYFNSCGVQQSLIQTCNNGCSGNTCNNVQQTKTLLSDKTVRNISSGNLNYAQNTTGNPLDMLEFKVVIRSNLNVVVNNVSVRETFSPGLINRGNLTVDGVPNSGNITLGVNIGSVFPGQIRIVTYQAQIDQNLPFGSTTVYGPVEVTSTDPGYYKTDTNIASIVTTKTQVYGVTDVPTGLTNDLLTDSFFLPLIFAIAGVWFFGIRNNQIRNLIIERKLNNRIKQIRDIENKN